MDLPTITAATVFSMFMNSAKSGDYYYNADVENNTVYSMTVYDNSTNYLVAKVKYDYTYDAQERLTCKEAYKWNADMQDWAKNYKLEYTYMNDGYTLERSEWNATKGEYEAPSEKSIYKNELNNLSSIVKFERDNDKKDLVMTDRMLVMSPLNDLLIAEK